MPVVRQGWIRLHSDSRDWLKYAESTQFPDELPAWFPGVGRGFDFDHGWHLRLHHLCDRKSQDRVHGVAPTKLKYKGCYFDPCGNQVICAAANVSKSAAGVSCPLRLLAD